MGIYLQPTGPTAPHAVLTGDPKRAMELANLVLLSPRMSNLNRGLWGYHGETEAGLELTVQSTGIGGPSAAIVAHELAELGVAEAVRVGTCLALAGGPDLGSTVVVIEALVSGRRDRQRIVADTALVERLVNASESDAQAVCAAQIERYYDPDATARRSAWASDGAEVADLCTGALFEAAQEREIAVASTLIVSESDDGSRLPEDELERRLLALGERVARMLLG